MRITIFGCILTIFYFVTSTDGRNLSDELLILLLIFAVSVQFNGSRVHMFYNFVLLSLHTG